MTTTTHEISHHNAATFVGNTDFTRVVADVDNLVHLADGTFRLMSKRAFPACTTWGRHYMNATYRPTTAEVTCPACAVHVERDRRRALYA